MGLYGQAPLTGGGALTRANIETINRNFAAVANPDVFVRPQYGNNATGELGNFERPFATMAGLSRVLKPGMVVGLLGVLFEEYSGPIIGDVTIVGLGNQPRQATTSGIPNGGGATWLSPSGGTGILCKINGQGWTLQNIFFNNSAAQPCVQLLTAGDPPAAADGAHTSILGCKFTGADSGVQASGGGGFNLIDGCTFFNFTGSGDCGIEAVTGAGIGTLLGWQISNNWFYNNDNHVILPLSTGRVFGNDFVIVGASVTATRALKLDGGVGSNSVYNNAFNRPLATSPNATLYVGGTNDVWTLNYGTDGTFYGVPDNS